MTDEDQTDEQAEEHAKNVVDRIREELDIPEDEDLVIQTPQFERQDGVEPGEPPLTEDAMERLKEADEEELKELGLRKWSEESGLWLLPHDWHEHIPPEYPLVDINTRNTKRADLPANPDKRAGVLSVGIIPKFERGNA